MAVKTYRDKARAEKKHIKKPNIIAPESVHVAFNKACEYFNIELKLAKLDSKTKKVDSNHVERLIDKNTIALIGSAPQYPHGVIDPIEELSSIAQKYNLWLHVDACVGGFLLPYYEMLGLEIPKFDFRIPHVTSISADLHKYAFAPKGASVVLYRSIDFLKYQFFICENFPGGAYASTALMGTKSGGSIAGAWAVLNYYGKKGYLEIAKKTYELTTKFKDAISQIDGLKIVGMPESSLFAYESIDPKINIYAVADVLSKKGYLIDRQQNPESIHAMITPNHEKIFEEYINDLKEAVKIVKENPNLSLSGQAAVYGMVSKLPIRSIVRHEILKILIESYSNTSENLNNKNLETQNTALDHSLPFWQKFILKILMFFKK
jgi:glutamate/tyrosine decarboxylase-like PLP-dependent enzyme